tara:strand:+ start:9 stop:776 length:768 start_codon:yes stop_codon:yes gene_type:complete
MKLIPAIDLMNGKCVRLVKGDFNESKEFSNDPVAQAVFWEKEGAESIHIVDLDAAKTGNPVNDTVIKNIAKSINIPIQIGGGIRSKDRIEKLFLYGIDKVIMGTAAVEDKYLVKELTLKYPRKIIIGIDANKGKVSTRGWLKQSEVKATELIGELSNFKISSFIVTDINTDGTLDGPNLTFMNEILNSTKLPIIASGGVGSLKDLVSLMQFESNGLIGVIVGKALYENIFTIKEGNEILSTQNFGDFKPNKNFYA